MQIFLWFSSVPSKCQGVTHKDGARPTLFQIRPINFYAVTSSLILVWPLWVWIRGSLPTKVVNCVVLCIVCICVLYYCHRVSIQLQLTNISISITLYATFPIFLLLPVSYIHVSLQHSLPMVIGSRCRPGPKSSSVPVHKSKTTFAPADPRTKIPTSSVL
jgi:hypothetical protein